MRYSNKTTSPSLTVETDDGWGCKVVEYTKIHAFYRQILERRHESVSCSMTRVEVSEEAKIRETKRIKVKPFPYSGSSFSIQ